MRETSTLTHRLLVAMPSMKDPNFFHGVIYIFEHNESGAVGIAINIPLQATLGDVLKHLQIPIRNSEIANQTVVMGGPISKDQGFVISCDEDLLAIDGDYQISISSSKEVLQDLADDHGPKHSLVAMGYASWGSGQLEQEIADNFWLIAPPDPRVLFEVPYTDRWKMAASLVGVDFDRLSPDVGHA